MTEQDPNLAPEGDEDQIAAAAWAEADDADQTGAESSPSDEGHETADQPTTDETDAGFDPEPGAADEGSAETPSEPTPEAKANPWAKAPKELREQYEEAQRRAAILETQFNRERGRTAALTKKLDTVAAPPPPAKDPEERKRSLEKLREEYPEVAEPLLEVLNEQQQKLDSLTAVEQSRTVQSQEAEAAKLRQAHPDYEEVTSKFGEQLVAWAMDERQPVWVAKALERNGGAITNAAEAKALLDGFKKFMGFKAPEGSAPAPGQSPSRLSERRQRQLEGSITPSTRTAPATQSGIPAEGEEDAIWASIDADEARKARRRA